MPTFEIPDGPTTISIARSGDPARPQPAEGSAVYSVTNTSSESVVGRLSVKVTGAAKAEWFLIDGDRERTFDPGETQTATVKVRFPPDVAEGDYPFRLRAVAVNDPDNDHAEGPATIARLGPGAIVYRKSWLWLWILLAVLALLLIGGGIWYAVTRKPPDSASAASEASGYRLPLKVMANLQDLGDRTGREGEWVGTKGQARRLEAFAVSYARPPRGFGLEYMCHVQDVGDSAWLTAGALCGTRGQSRRVEGFAMRLAGPDAAAWTVQYQCHVQGSGDSAVMADGQYCGTRGQSLRVEAMLVTVTRR